MKRRDFITLLGGSRRARSSRLLPHVVEMEGVPLGRWKRREPLAWWVPAARLSSSRG
jgi:hypothetical protein